jgi:septal ring factor EnvC (AmiA/AmiB activator)
MIWIVLVLVVLCVAMSCVALWYREKWQKAKESYANMSDLYYEMKEKYNDERDERERLSISISSLNIEVDATKEKLQKSEFQCDLLNKEIADKNARLLKLLDENNKLRSQLPKRDNKGRYCKK